MAVNLIHNRDFNPFDNFVLLGKHKLISGWKYMYFLTSFLPRNHMDLHISFGCEAERGKINVAVDLNVKSGVQV